MTTAFYHPYIGQKALIKGGGTIKGYIGVVTDWRDEFPHQEIWVEHPFSKIRTRYAPSSVTLLGLEV